MHAQSAIDMLTRAEEKDRHHAEQQTDNKSGATRDTETDSKNQGTTGHNQQSPQAEMKKQSKTVMAHQQSTRMQVDTHAHGGGGQHSPLQAAKPQRNKRPPQQTLAKDKQKTTDLS